jgi:hypothetical protein
LGGATGCGKDDEPAAAAPSTLPDLTAPQPKAAEPVAPETETAPPPPTETAPPSTSGTTAPQQETAPDSAQQDTPPPTNSPAQRFEQFCRDNPGACG